MCRPLGGLRSAGPPSSPSSACPAPLAPRWCPSSGSVSFRAFRQLVEQPAALLHQETQRLPLSSCGLGTPPVRDGSTTYPLDALRRLGARTQPTMNPTATISRLLGHTPSRLSLATNQEAAGPSLRATSLPWPVTLSSPASTRRRTSPDADDDFSLVVCFSKQSNRLGNVTQRVDIVYRWHHLARFQKLSHALQPLVRFQRQNTNVSIPGSGNPSPEQQALDKSRH